MPKRYGEFDPYDPRAPVGSRNVSRWGKSKGKRKCEKWVTLRLQEAAHNVYVAMERHQCRSSLCDTRFSHAQQDVKDAFKALREGKCEEVLVTCEHLDMIARKRD